MDIYIHFEEFSHETNYRTKLKIEITCKATAKHSYFLLKKRTRVLPPDTQHSRTLAAPWMLSANA
jgi:hypothetical protein